MDKEEVELLEDGAEGEQIATKIEEEEGKKNKILIIILTSILGILIISLLVVFFILPKVSNGKAVIVPNCEGLKVSACEKKLQNLGFEVKTDIGLVASEKIEKNLVVKTDPEKGRSVKQGTKVTIYKSTGEETFKIEDYTGKNYIEVQTILKTQYGLDVKVEKKEPPVNENQDKEYDEQEIIGQSLAAGSEVKKGDSIILYIPDIDTEFPDMNANSWSLADAEAFCTKYGLIIEIEYVPTDKYEEGKIISQSRAAGSPIVKGATLTVEVAKKPTVTTPAAGAPTEDIDKDNNTTVEKDEEKPTTTE